MHVQNVRVASCVKNMPSYTINLEWLSTKLSPEAQHMPSLQANICLMLMP